MKEASVRAKPSIASGLPVFLPILKRRDSHVFAEMTRERTLIVKAEVHRNFRNRAAGFSQGVAAGVDPHFHDELLRRRFQVMLKFPFELANGHGAAFGQCADREILIEMGANVTKCPRNVFFRWEPLPMGVVILDRAHDSDGDPGAIENGAFIGKVPIRNSFAVDEEFDDLQERLCRFHHLKIIFPKLLGQAAGKQIEIGFPENVFFLHKAIAPQQGTIGSEKSSFTVFREKQDALEMIEELVKVKVGIDRVQKTGSEFKGSYLQNQKGKVRNILQMLEINTLLMRFKLALKKSTLQNRKMGIIPHEGS